MPVSRPARNGVHTMLGVGAIALFAFTAVSGILLPSPPRFKATGAFLEVTGRCRLRELRENDHECLIAYRYEVGGQTYDSENRVVLWEERDTLPQMGGLVPVFYRRESPGASYSP